MIRCINHLKKGFELSNLNEFVKGFLELVNFSDQLISNSFFSVLILINSYSPVTGLKMM